MKTSPIVFKVREARVRGGKTLSVRSNRQASDLRKSTGIPRTISYPGIVGFDTGDERDLVARAPGVN
ncbi:MAG: hypothetical protein KDA91_23665, partial [Planctomycetaceae bacterium]|nr:hypothetical protein [Planctomycetaceae bacterium]